MIAFGSREEPDRQYPSYPRSPLHLYVQGENRKIENIFTVYSINHKRMLFFMICIYSFFS